MNDALRKLIKRHEGLSLIPYRCPALKLSIGWGWNIDANPLPPTIDAHLKEHGSITASMAEELLDISLERAVRDAKKLYPDYDSYSENRRNALASMAFQMGYRSLSTFTRSNYYVRQKDWEGAANNFALSKWATKDTPKRAKEVLALLRDG